VTQVWPSGHKQNGVKVFVEGSAAEGIALEQVLKEQYNLNC